MQATLFMQLPIQRRKMCRKQKLPHSLQSFQERRTTLFKVSLFRIIDYVGLVISTGTLAQALQFSNGGYQVHNRKLILNQVGFPLMDSYKFLKWPEGIMLFRAVTCCQISK